MSTSANFREVPLPLIFHLKSCQNPINKFNWYVNVHILMQIQKLIHYKSNFLTGIFGPPPLFGDPLKNIRKSQF